MSKTALKLALETAEQIACADYRHWEELASLSEFERWARSRANHIAYALRTALAQPEKEWVGLTDAEAMEIEDKSPDIRWAIIQAEAKLKEKNT